MGCSYQLGITEVEISIPIAQGSKQFGNDSVLIQGHGASKWEMGLKIMSSDSQFFDLFFL